MVRPHPRPSRAAATLLAIALPAALAAGLAATSLPGAASAQADASVPETEERWESLREHYFGDAVVASGEGLMELDAPMRAHDAAVVPIAVHALDSSRPIVRLHLFVDDNPLPLAGIVEFAERARGWQSLETRIRINEYTHVRAVAETEGGDLHMVSRFVKAAGGCSAPALSDRDAAMANAGRMKLLLGDGSATLPSSPVSEAVVKISHPNSSGMQFDQISRTYIPAFYVEGIETEVDGEPLFEVRTNFSMSENPTVRLRWRGDAAPGTLEAWATDSKGNRYDASTGES